MEAGNLRDVISLLEKYSNERKPGDLQMILAATNGVKFFKSQSEEVHLACCKVMKAKKYEANDIIFNKGDPGDSFCIILQGSVNVLVPQSGSRLSDVSSLRLVSVLSEGQAFGELSLLQNQNRAATVQSREQTYLAILDKHDFNRILRINEGHKLNEKIQFFQKLPPFSEWSEAQLSRFVYYFHEEHFRRGTTIFHEGDIATKVYVVITGEFKFTEDSEVCPGKDLKTKHSLHREIQLLFKGPKEMFGEEEVLSGRKRMNTCTCSSFEGSLHCISTDDFLKFCQQDSTLRYLHKYNRIKKQWMDERRPAILKAENTKITVNLPGKPPGSRSFLDLSHVDLSSLKQDLVLHRTVKAVPAKSQIRLSSMHRGTASDRGVQQLLTSRSDVAILRSLLNVPITPRMRNKENSMQRQFHRLVKLRSLG